MAEGLRRGLRALDLLGEDDAGLGVLDVARRLGVDKSQASRTLRELADHGLAERDPVTLAYRLGPRVFAYAARVADRRLLRAAPPVLAELVAALGERAHLSVRDGDVVLTLLSESPPHAIQAAGWAGRTVPLANTASGRALLLDHDPAAVAALIGPAAVHVEAARERGWTSADGELEPGLAAVAAPVRGFDGRIVAVVNVSGPSFRFAARLDEAGPQVAAAADRVAMAATGVVESRP